MRVGSSTAVFRTREFRNFFRELQSLDGIRACYSPTNIEDPGKALVSGHCDLYIGGWHNDSTRFVTREIGFIEHRFYRRNGGRAGDVSGPSLYVVSLDGHSPDYNREAKGQELQAPLWLYWLDHPEECPVGTAILGPHVEIDPKCWTLEDDHPQWSPVRQPLYASYLRQHPYEFLPWVIGKIENRASST
jgi:hypothetical protein